MQTNGLAAFSDPATATAGTMTDDGFDPGAGAPTYATVPAFLLDEGAALDFNAAGVPTESSDAQLFVERGTIEQYGIRTEHTVRFTYENNDTVDAVILRAVRATGVIQLRRV